MTTQYDEKAKRFIDRYWLRYFRSPTIREIGEHLDITSTSHVNYILDSIGYVGNKTARNIIPEWVKKAIKEYKGEQ